MSTKWDLVSFVKASSYRQKVLENLDKPATPTELAKGLNLNRSHVSRALIDLVEKRLVICLTPSAKRARLYQRTKVGKDILEKL